MRRICQLYMTMSKVFKAVLKWERQLWDLLADMVEIEALQELVIVYIDSISQSSLAFQGSVIALCNNETVSQGLLNSLSQFNLLPRIILILSTEPRRPVAAVILCSAVLLPVRKRTGVNFTSSSAPNSQKSIKVSCFPNVQTVRLSFFRAETDRILAPKRDAPRSSRFHNIIITSFLNAPLEQKSRIEIRSDRIRVADLSSSIGVNTSQFSIDEWRLAVWNSSSDGKAWLPRCESFIEDIKTDNSLRIVEIVFFNDYVNVAVVLAKVRETELPGDPSLRQYTILSTITCLWCVFPILN